MINIIKDYNPELDNATLIEERIIAHFKTIVDSKVRQLEEALLITKADDRYAKVKGIRMLAALIEPKPYKEVIPEPLPWDA